MPKLLIPYYAIDIQTWTCVLSYTADVSFDIGKALSTDLREYCKWNNADTNIKSTYSNLATMESSIEDTYGDDAVWAVYLRLASNAYLFEGGDGNFIRMQYSSNGTDWNNAGSLTAYGDGTASGGEACTIESTNPKLLYNGDGELVCAATGVYAYQYHRTRLDCALDYIYRDVDYRLQHYIDGLLVNLPDLQQERAWQEEYAGGFTKRTPDGKVLPFGFKNEHVRRGRRTFKAMFNEITTSDKDKLLACFRVGKGMLPMLFMADETSNNTWIVSKFAEYTEREPHAGVWFVEATFEEF